MRLTDPYNVAEFRARSLTIAIFFSVLIGILILRLWYLQIWQGELYRQFSDQNRFKIERLSAPRGQVFDREGRLLADNRPRFNVNYVRGYAQDLTAEFQILGDIFQWPAEEKNLKFEKVKNSGRYKSVELAQDISQEVLAHLQVNSLDLPGLDLEVQSVRDYLYNDLFFHILGYTGEINDQELERLQKRFPERNYRRGDQRGIIGVEALHEPSLRGVDGRDFLVVDVKGRRVNSEQWALLPEVRREEPQAGRMLQLSLDLDLQQAAVRAFGTNTGAAVAFDPRNGEVLAYVSRPALDPNLFTQVLRSEDFKRLTSQNENPFLDRVVGEHYPPGSTLKLVMAAAALENGVIDERTTHFCGGSFRFGRRVWGCHKRDGHGRVNIIDAIEQSCDVFFYNVGLSLGLDAMFSWSARFGLGRRTFLGSEFLKAPQENLYRFNSEQIGFLPYEDWILARRHTTVEAETINAAIGQGAYLVTLLQLVRTVSAFGNDGKIFEPLLVLEETNIQTGEKKSFDALVENNLHLDSRTRRIILKGMEQVVEGSLGTARGSRLPKIHFGGKTGTSQVVQLDVWKKRAKAERNFEDHGLFVGLAPIDKPELAVAVIVEHGGQGSRSAAPIAKQIIQAHFEKTMRAEVNHDDAVVR